MSALIQTSVIEDKLISVIKAGIPTMKTIDTCETRFDSNTFDRMIVFAPFALIYHVRLFPTKKANDNSMLEARNIFHVYIGDRSLRSTKEGQRGAYGYCSEVMQALNKYFFVNAEETRKCSVSFNDESFVASQNGLVVYVQEYYADQFIF